MTNEVPKRQMRNCVLDRLDETKGILIKEVGKDGRYIWISQREKEDQKNLVPKQTCIYLHYDKMRVEDYLKIASDNSRMGIYTVPIFCNHDDIFFKRLGKIANFKGDNRSLKNYSLEELAKIVEVRSIIKSALSQLEYGTKPSLKILDFYDEEKNSIMGYSFEQVDLDYSHLSPTDPSYPYAKNGTSKSLMLMTPKFSITEGGVASRLDNPQLKIATIIPPKKLK